ncbi:MAG: glutamine synthetase family protein [Myxococcales bacterium]
MDLNQLRERFAAHDVRRVKVGGFDIDGVLRGKYLSLDKFWSIAESGFGFCDVIFGWDIGDVCYDNTSGPESGYPDILAKVDAGTFRLLPYEPNTAAFLLDFRGTDGKAHFACPRSLLKRIVARAEAAGYVPTFGAEFEFWVFRETPQTLRNKGFQQLEPLTPGMFGYSWLRTGQHKDFVHELFDACENFDIPIEGLHTETGPGVYEVALKYGLALDMADRAALFKTLAKEVASHHGLSVTFMAKWNPSLPGSSGHLHQSLWDSTREKNLFADPKAPHGLSTLGRHYLGGLLSAMDELTALYSPTINSYKRYVPGVWAPLTPSWGVENRTTAIRLIPGDKPSATRIEYRQTAADMNPYIAMATCLAAGLHGVEHAIEPGEPQRGDASHSKGKRLPTDLGSATALLKQSEVARSLLGAPFVDHYVLTREWEVRQFAKAVSDWELKRYFESI